MYQLIEANWAIVLGAIDNYHVTEYDWLIANLPVVNVSLNKQYQMRYAKYWGLSPVFVNNGWLANYFLELEAAKTAMPAPVCNNICRALYGTPSTSKLACALQYSFCSKIVHMVRQNDPIFDSRVEAFYFFFRPASSTPLGQRIIRHDAFMNFLRCEYQRVIRNGLLRQAIANFRARFHPVNFTDEKIIDSLIWAWIKVSKRRQRIPAPRPYVINPLGVAIPVCGPVGATTIREGNSYFRKFMKRIEDLIAKGIPVREIVIRFGSSGVSIPKWFEDWCKVKNVTISAGSL